jgi:SsrA-binding protein
VTDTTIISNRKAYHDYTIEERFEAGLVLQGWEVKAIRAGRVQLRDAYVVLRHGEAFLLGGLITPLPSASTHVEPDPRRTRKLLLHRKELRRLLGMVERRGYTLVPLDLHYSGQRVKLSFGLAKGKKLYDKRQAAKDRDWTRQKARLQRHA